MRPNPRTKISTRPSRRYPKSREPGGRRKSATERSGGTRTGSLVRREECLVREPEQQGRFPDAGCTCLNQTERRFDQSLRRENVYRVGRRCALCSGVPVPAARPDRTWTGYTRDCTMQRLDCSLPLSHRRSVAACRPTPVLSGDPHMPPPSPGVGTREEQSEKTKGD